MLIPAEGKLVHPQLLERYTWRAKAANLYVGSEEAYNDRINSHFEVVLAAIAAGRAEVVRMHRARDIDDDTLHMLERDLDIEEIGALEAKVS